ncbi:tetratricopeptide repeat protein [Cetobacterium sp.]|uniref:tetratricopeptide repeat protein n=1 Tax=Cetobacterium sp. TaxID=2071632 RepID=UPI003F387607
MKFLQVVILSTTLVIRSFSYNVDDYIFLNKGIVANENKDYKKSLFFYDIYQKNFIYSYPLTSNYAKYYIAKNYMDMGRLDDALLWFSRAVYIPASYLKQELKKTNFFQYRRDFFIGEIYMEKDEKEKALEYFERLILDYYDPVLEVHEKKALQILRELDIKYDYIYSIKYDNAINLIDKISESEQLKIINYFYEKRSYSEVVQIIDKLNNYEKIDFKLKLVYIRSLLKIGGNRRVIEITNDAKSEQIIFLRGVAFEQSKDFSRAIYNYKSIKDLRVKDRSLFRIARIYYQLEDYKKARDIIEKIKNQDENMKSLNIDIYIKLKNKKRFIENYNEFKEMYPQNHKMGLYYMVYNKLNKKINNPWELADYNIFFSSNYVVRNYTSSLEDYKVENGYKEEVLKNALNQIGEFKKPELLELAVQSTTFDLDIESVQDKITIMDSYIKSKFYKEAFIKMDKFKKDFYRYRNLLHYLYPKYYRSEVEKARKKTILPQSLIYTVIYTESGFDKENIKFGKIGLMGIPKELIKGREEQYYNPEKNLEEGIERLKEIYVRHVS